MQQEVGEQWGHFIENTFWGFRKRKREEKTPAIGKKLGNKNMEKRVMKRVSLSNPCRLSFLSLTCPAFLSLSIINTTTSKFLSRNPL
jgi:hypothetical protein